MHSSARCARPPGSADRCARCTSARQAARDYPALSQVRKRRMAYGRAARCSVDMFCAAFLRRIWLGTVIFAAGLRMSWRSMRHGVRRSASLPVQRRGLSPQGALIGARAHYALRKLRHPCPALMLMPVRRSAPLPVHRCGITAAVALIGAQANYAPRILHRAYPALTLTSFQRRAPLPVQRRDRSPQELS